MWTGYNSQIHTDDDDTMDGVKYSVQFNYKMFAIIIHIRYECIECMAIVCCVCLVEFVKNLHLNDGVWTTFITYFIKFECATRRESQSSRKWRRLKHLQCNDAIWYQILLVRDFCCYTFSVMTLLALYDAPRRIIWMQSLHKPIPPHTHTVE